MRRLAWCALALAAACGTEPKQPTWPQTALRMPAGLAVVDGRLLAVSSNADLYYDEASGGGLLALAPEGPTSLSVIRQTGQVAVHSLGGDLAVAHAAAAGVLDAEDCTTLLAHGQTLAVFATRGSSTVNAVSVGAGGALSCAGPAARCNVAAGGAGFADPLGVAVACGGGRARAYFGYLTAQGNNFWVGELDLNDFTVRNAGVGLGSVRDLAYDRDRDRLFMTGLATGAQTPLRWFDLAGCTFGASGPGGCTLGSLTLPIVAGPYGVELHGIALGRQAAGRGAAEPLRAYLSGVVYDLGTAATNGFRTTSFGGVLAAVDLLDDARGGVTAVIQTVYDVPSGAQTVRVLPRLPGWSAARRDVVAVVSVDVGTLTVIDDETGAMETIGLDAAGPAATGGPLLGHQAFGLAVDPALAGSTARLWVGSFRESFVTPIDVTLDATFDGNLVATGAAAPDPALAVTFAGGRQLKISGATP